jgi:transposase InsO family protein
MTEEKQNLNEIIKKVYYDPTTGFQSPYKIYKRLKQTIPDIKVKDIKNVIDKQSIYQTTKLNIGRMGSFIPQHPLHEFQCDLIYLENKNLNKNNKYALVVIDVFSKFVDIELLKKKTAGETVEAMQKILNKMGIPKLIYCDEGSEFNNKEFKKLCDDHKIEIIFSLSHAPVVERVNRTIKAMLYRYLESTNSKTFINVLPSILKAYNSSYHTTIKMSPNEALDEKNHRTVLHNIVQRSRIINRPKIEVGDLVRFRIKPKTYDKKYKSQFSKTIHKVDSIDDRYYIIDGRKYLRANIIPVQESEENPNEPDYENSQEQHLRNLAKNRPERDTTPLPIEESIAKTKPRRGFTIYE